MVRSRFTWTSKALVIGRLVTAWIRVRRVGARRTSSAIRAQSRRAARSFAIVANCSSVAASRSSIRPKPCSAAMPASSSVRSIGGATGEHPAELLTVGGALLVHGRAVDDHGPHTRLQRRAASEGHELGVVGAQVAVGVQRGPARPGTRPARGSATRARPRRGRAGRPRAPRRGRPRPRRRAARGCSRRTRGRRTAAAASPDVRVRTSHAARARGPARCGQVVRAGRACRAG